MEYRPRPGEFEGFLDHIYISHHQGKHKTEDCDRVHGFADEVLKTTKGADQEKKPKEPKGDFPEAHQEVNYIYGGPVSHPVFKTKTRCSSYVCPGSSCHTYGQNVSTEYQCFYYIVSYYKNLLEV
jgi:hypothetical protein